MNASRKEEKKKADKERKPSIYVDRFILITDENGRRVYRGVTDSESYEVAISRMKPGKKYYALTARWVEYEEEGSALLVERSAYDGNTETGRSTMIENLSTSKRGVKKLIELLQSLPLK